MVLMNFFRSERFKFENVFFVGVIFGFYELKYNINLYLQFLVVEFNFLWKDGISVKKYGFIENEKFYVVFFCVGCDILVVRKVCGFIGYGLNKGCLKCKKFFFGLVGIKIDFLGFELCFLRSNNEY